MKKHPSSSAFTLVEVVIGVAVLSIVMFSITILTITSIRANEANIHKLTAYYLGQEALEGIRNVRDSNWLQNHAWNSGGSAYSPFSWGTDFSSDGYYTIEYVPNGNGSTPPWELEYLGAVLPADIDSNAMLYRAEDPVLGDVFYLHDLGAYAGNPFFYHRYLHIDYDDVEEGVFQVTAYVYWSEHEIDRSVVVSTELSDWRQGPI